LASKGFELARPLKKHNFNEYIDTRKTLEVKEINEEIFVNVLSKGFSWRLEVFHGGLEGIQIYR
jgi:hypothetical protein